MSDTSTTKPQSAVSIIAPAPDPNTGAVLESSTISLNPTTYSGGGTDIALSTGNSIIQVPTIAINSTVATTNQPSSSFVARSLSTVSGDFEAAVTDLESFVSSKAAYVESYIAAELAILKAKAEAEYNKIVSDKQSLVVTLDTEFNLTKAWISDKFKKIVSSL